MTAYEVFIKRSAENELDTLRGELHERIVARLRSLTHDPRPHGSKKLRGREGYRLRVGQYRVLYTIDDQRRRIEIVSIAHRREVYR